MIGRRWPGLTPCETGIAALICEGKTRSEIADFLAISRRTYDTHRTATMRKFEVRNEVELLRKAIALGLVAVHPAPREELVDGRDGASL